MCQGDRAAILWIWRDRAGWFGLGSLPVVDDRSPGLGARRAETTESRPCRAGSRGVGGSEAQNAMPTLTLPVISESVPLVMPSSSVICPPPLVSSEIRWYDSWPRT